MWFFSPPAISECSSARTGEATTYVGQSQADNTAPNSQVGPARAGAQSSGLQS